MCSGRFKSFWNRWNSWVFKFFKTKKFPFRFSTICLLWALNLNPRIGKGSQEHHWCGMTDFEIRNAAMWDWVWRRSVETREHTPENTSWFSICFWSRQLFWARSWNPRTKKSSWKQHRCSLTDIDIRNANIWDFVWQLGVERCEHTTENTPTKIFKTENLCAQASLGQCWCDQWIEERMNFMMLMSILEFESECSHLRLCVATQRGDPWTHNCEHTGANLCFTGKSLNSIFRSSPGHRHLL